jgi:uncharacterized lipoprotein YmbA
MRPALRRVRTLRAAAAMLGAALLLAACASSPPTRWYELRADPPPAALAAVSAAQAAAADGRGPWVLSPRLGLPGALDRDTLMVASGSAGLQPLPGHRWVEPLRQAVPRLLLHDLQRLRGTEQVRPGPAPPGLAAAQLLQVELLELRADATLRRLRLLARWELQSIDGSTRRTGQADLEVPVEDGASADALAAAHRLALWQLAERIAATP